jgi:hypothetical protein
MSENTQPTGDQNPQPERRYWIDEDGNVHGIVLTTRVDHFTEFTDQAIDLTPGAPKPDAPTA